MILLNLHVLISLFFKNTIFLKCKYCIKISCDQYLDILKKIWLPATSTNNVYNNNTTSRESQEAISDIFQYSNGFTLFHFSVCVMIREYYKHC